VVNKWDKVLGKPGINKDTIQKEYMSYLKLKFDFLSYVTPVFTSAINGKRVDEILDVAAKIKDERLKRVKT
jgi:predicted GTPase